LRCFDPLSRNPDGETIQACVNELFLETKMPRTQTQPRALRHHDHAVLGGFPSGVAGRRREFAGMPGVGRRNT
jgi:hypothetical protein